MGDMQKTVADFRSRLGRITQGGSDSEDDPDEKRRKAEDKRRRAEKEKKRQETDDGSLAAVLAEEKEGDEDDDWLDGGGLSFHVSADKAFKLSRDRAMKTLSIFDPLAAEGNAEQLAEVRKKYSEKAIPLKRPRAQRAQKDDKNDDRNLGGQPAPGRR